MLGSCSRRDFGVFGRSGLFIFVIFGLVSTCSGGIEANTETGIESMKVHPIPKKRNITFQYDINSSLSEVSNSLSSFPLVGRLKKLRRLPHIFSRVLELPFRSDADVSIHETVDHFRFVITTNELSVDVQARVIEIHPGVTKIVVREGNSLELPLDELELDMWRFRLPRSTRPGLATAVYADGELVVTVPKGDASGDSKGEGGGGEEEEFWGEEGSGELRGGFGRLVLVQ